MIITSRKEVFYKIEVTAQQAHNLQLLLQTGVDGHVNELSIQAEHGTETANDVHETIGDLRIALEKR